MILIQRSGLAVEVGRRARLPDDAVRRARACMMYLMKQSDYSTAEIATLFRVSRRLVNREIKSMPDAAKRRAWSQHLGPMD